MKNHLYLIIIALFIYSACDNENMLTISEEVPSEEISENNIKSKKDKITICHRKGNGTWHSISVSPNAVKAHLKHGDVIIDQDGDGYAAFNECGILNDEGIDCNDNDATIHPGAEEICEDGIDNNCNGEIDEGCRTYIPDDNFEKYLIEQNYDDVLDDYVVTANISVIKQIGINKRNIKDLTGIEDFIALEYLSCASNQLTKLDMSNNTALVTLYCQINQLTSLNVSNTAIKELKCNANKLVNLNVSNCIALEKINCSKNNLTSLDVSDNEALITLICYNNQLKSLDVSNNTLLNTLSCYSNQLTSLNLKNGNNSAITFMSARTNPELKCIQVDNVTDALSYTNWKVDGFDEIFSVDCGN